ncbi:MAG: glycosyltransferase, partial [Pseudomonadota bacterium]
MMTPLVIGICTYRRNDGLARVLTSISHQRLSSSRLQLHPDGTLENRPEPGFRGEPDTHGEPDTRPELGWRGELRPDAISVLVIDNSPEGAARSLVDALAPEYRFPITYRHEPRTGLAYARNAAVEEALAGNASYLAFIDDDEMPEPQWIAALYSRLVRTHSAAAVGPAYPMFAGRPKWNLPIASYATRTKVVGGFTNEGYTCNVLFDLGIVRDLELRFDLNLNQVGGEDTMFFKAIRDGNHTIAWAEDAVVHDLIPPHRMTAVWLFRRWYRTGSIEARLGHEPPNSWRGRVRNLFKGGLRIA